MSDNNDRDMFKPLIDSMERGYQLSLPWYKKKATKLWLKKLVEPSLILAILVAISGVYVYFHK